MSRRVSAVGPFSSWHWVGNSEFARELQAPNSGHEEQIRQNTLREQQDQQDRADISAEVRAYLRSVRRHQARQDIEDQTTLLIENRIVEVVERIIIQAATEAVEEARQAERIQVIRNRRISNSAVPVPEWWSDRRSSDPSSQWQ